MGFMITANSSRDKKLKNRGVNTLPTQNKSLLAFMENKRTNKKKTAVKTSRYRGRVWGLAKVPKAVSKETLPVLGMANKGPMVKVRARVIKVPNQGETRLPMPFSPSSRVRARARVPRKINPMAVIKKPKKAEKKPFPPADQEQWGR